MEESKFKLPALIGWILLLPAYWIASIIVWFVSVFLLTLFSEGSVFFWIMALFVFPAGAIIFPIAIIIAVLDELSLPIKPAIIVLLINNVIGISWTINNGGYTFEGITDIFGIAFSGVSTLALILFLFIKKQPE